MTARFRLAVVPFVLAGLLAGCGDGGPKTYPVKGKVVVKNGDVKPLIGGYVRLVSAADTTVIGMGEIEDDGGFGIGSFFEGKPRGGLPEGEYHARVEPPEFDQRQSDDEPPPPKKGDLLPKYQRYDASGLKYTIKPGDNTITVEVELKR